MRIFALNLLEFSYSALSHQDALSCPEDRDVNACLQLHSDRVELILGIFRPGWVGRGLNHNKDALRQKG